MIRALARYCPVRRDGSGALAGIVLPWFAEIARFDLLHRSSAARHVIVSRSPKEPLRQTVRILARHSDNEGKVFSIGAAPVIISASERLLAQCRPKLTQRRHLLEASMIDTIQRRLPSGLAGSGPARKFGADCLRRDGRRRVHCPGAITPACVQAMIGK